ncbi:MAG: hypothetical protein M3N31_06855 [Actinomycetota bacterium]|nr:hypothetical protein [Actinomycetota bacterium]
MAVGAAVASAVAILPAVVLRLVVGDEPQGVERNLWVVAVVVLLAGFGYGGHVAARRRPDAPYLHAAAAAAVGFLAFLAFTLGRRLVAGDGVSAALLVTLVVLFQITVSCAVVGAYVAWRRSRSRRGTALSR